MANLRLDKKKKCQLYKYKSQRNDGLRQERKASQPLFFNAT